MFRTGSSIVLSYLGLALLCTPALGCSAAADDGVDSGEMIAIDSGSTGTGSDAGAADVVEESDAGPVEPDAAVVDMGPAIPFELGRCVLVGSTEDCSGQSGEFVPLGDGDGMRIVSGGQGSAMLVFMARTSGLNPGLPNNRGTNPVLELLVEDESGAVVGELRTRVELEKRDEFQVTPRGVFFVVDGLAGIRGQMLHVSGVLADIYGERRVGSVDITVAR